MNLASFDIFDTILIRKCGRPENIFYLMARRLFPEDEPRGAAFIAWRKRAEEIACKKNNSANISFHQIYESFDEKDFNLKKEYVSNMEKEIEWENLITNPEVENSIKRKRIEGYHICFISDMYLDSVFLKHIFEKNDIILPEEEIFVSCEHNSRKSTGKLFEIVRAKLNPDKWEHYGDNYISDYKYPKKMGIQASQVDTGYTKAEELLLNKYKYYRFQSELSIYIGFQRAARIVGGDNSFSEIAADFVAPVYISYILFVLEQARKYQIKRLYFVNRDGYLLMKIAEMFIQEYPEIEIKYIFISRKAIAPASFIRLDPDLLVEIMNPQTLIGRKVTELLSYLDINREHLSEMGIGFKYERITNSTDANDFTDKIFHSEYTPFWEKKIKQSRKIFRQYLDQEGVTDGVNSAMVDLGWYGSTRLMLNRFLEYNNYPHIPFFYLSAADNAIAYKYGTYFSYIPYRLIENSGLMALMEHYFSACPYNSVISYTEQNDKIVPVFNKQHTQGDGYARIISENIEVTERIISYMKEVINLRFESILDLVSIDYSQIMRDQSVKINLVACTVIENKWDTGGSSQYIVKKLNLVETMRYAMLGSRITAFDKASVTFTYGTGLKGLFFFNKYSDKLRRYLYRKYMVLCQNRISK